jgi:hypothetical protein
MNTVGSEENAVTALTGKEEVPGFHMAIKKVRLITIKLLDFVPLECKKVRPSFQQGVETHWSVRRRGSHIF